MMRGIDLSVEPVESARLLCFKPLDNVEGARIALMAAHAPAGSVKPNVPVYSAALRRAGLSVVLIVASDQPVVVDSTLTNTLSGGFARDNRGFDFAAWAHVLKVAPELWGAETLFLLNDSVIGPLNQQRLDDLLQRVAESPADVVGATDNLELEWHLQTYFVALKPRALASKALRGFFDGVRNLSDKDAVIRTYEVPLTRILVAEGLVCAPVYRCRDGVNQTLAHWRALIEEGFPFVKTRLLRGLDPGWEIVGWRDTLAATGFNPAVAAATIAASDMTVGHEPSTEPSKSSYPPPSRQAVLVLGMHRSGTSAVAGVINALGAAAPKTPLVPQDDNPRGFFESAALVVAHDRLLAAAGSFWDDWRPLNPCWFRSEAGQQHRQKIKELMAEEFGDETLIFVKDPRICRFVPLVSSVLADLGFCTVAIVPIRNPLEVAFSLQRRNEFALSKSILLWLRHVLDSELHSRHMPRCFLSYENLLSDWRREMDLVAEKTAIRWPDRSDSIGLKIDEFLTAELHHEKFAFGKLDDHPDAFPLARDAYEILTDIVANGESKELLDRLDLLRMKFFDACRTFDLAVADMEAARCRLAAERGQLATARAELSAECAELRSERDGLAEARNSQIVTEGRLVQERDELKTERDALADSNKRLLTARDALLASTSWRVTAPLRRLRSLLSRS
jgi:hypothetical protein